MMSSLTKALIFSICAASPLAAFGQEAAVEPPVDPGPTNAELHERIRSLEARLEASRETVLTAMLAEKVEQLTAGIETDEERALAICEWVAANLSNRAQIPGDHLTWFAERAGYCGERATLAVEMLELAFIPARLFNIYNFGGPSGGHTGIEVHLDSAWRYVDVFYGGYFRRDGRILTWREITSDPEAALANTVVFERTRDRWYSGGAPVHERPKIDNHERMAINYTPEHLRAAARSAGPVGTTDLKILSPTIDIAETGLPFELGSTDRSGVDAEVEAIRLGLTEQLGGSANTYFDTFSVEWVLEGLEPGETYALTYRFYGWSRPGVHIGAEAKGAELRTEPRFTSPYTLPEEKYVDWVLEFVPEGSEAVIAITPEYEPQSGFFIDAVRLDRVSP